MDWIHHINIYKLFLLCILQIFSGCDVASDSKADHAHQNVNPNKLIQIVSTVGMVSDIVEKVGGRHVQVMQLMGAGVDPHLYKATRDDVRFMLQADIIFYAGLNLEGKMTDTLLKVSKDKPVIPVTRNLDEQYLLKSAETNGHPDPHVWMDVSAWDKCVDVVKEELIKFAPHFKDDFQHQAIEYHEQLQKIHEYGLKSLATIPENSRLLITSHDAFNYFGRAYNLEVKGVQGISTESEAGLLHVNHLVDEIVAKKIKAIFVESSVSQKSIEAIIEGVQTKGHTISIGGILFSDAMGEKGTYEGSYIGMLDHNITLVTKGLGGSCPDRGLSGRLSHINQNLLQTQAGDSSSPQ